MDDRICLDILRTRKSRRGEPMGPHVTEPVADDAHGRDAEMADSGGAALLVVLETLTPAVAPRDTPMSAWFPVASSFCASTNWA